MTLKSETQTINKILYHTVLKAKPCDTLDNAENGERIQ